MEEPWVEDEDEDEGEDEDEDEKIHTTKGGRFSGNLIKTLASESGEENRTSSYQRIPYSLRVLSAC